MITTTITSPNHKTKPQNKQTNKHLFISPTKKTTFPENFPGDRFGKERGLEGQVTATHVPKDS
jgi:hypothetical protein